MDYALVSFSLNLVYFTIAVATGWAVLRGLDKLNGSEFSNAQRGMEDGNLALAVYYGLRFMGICVIASAFLS
jgi:hypothetical protein